MVWLAVAHVRHSWCCAALCEQRWLTAAGSPRQAFAHAWTRLCCSLLNALQVRIQLGEKGNPFSIATRMIQNQVGAGQIRQVSGTDFGHRSLELERWCL